MITVPSVEWLQAERDRLREERARITSLPAKSPEERKDVKRAVEMIVQQTIRVDALIKQARQEVA